MKPSDLYYVCLIAAFFLLAFEYSRETNPKPQTITICIPCEFAPGPEGE